MMVQKLGYLPMIGNVNVDSNEHVDLSYSLNPIDIKRARTLAMLYPGMGHKYLGQKKVARRWNTIQSTLIISSLYFLIDYYGLSTFLGRCFFNENQC